MKIMLKEWAAQNFSPAPHKNTLCNWVREGRISPAPVFIGRAYWVESTARYITDQTEDHRKKRRLVDRIG